MSTPRFLAALALAAGLFAAPPTAAQVVQVTQPGVHAPEAVEVILPSGYQPGQPAPLLVLLHGYTSNSRVFQAFLGIRAHADARGYILAVPNGKKNPNGKAFWNGTDGCCDFFGENPDHVGYLSTLLDYLEQTYTVDPTRIHFLGHSNGAFMSHRLACELPGRIASIVAIVGTGWMDPAACPAAGEVHVLQVHGTLDPLFYGTSIIPSAQATVLQWVDKLGCSTTSSFGAPLDYTVSVAGIETEVRRYGGCRPGASVEFWRVVGGEHIMFLSDAGRTAIFDYLDSHPQPAALPPFQGPQARPLR